MTAWEGELIDQPGTRIESWDDLLPFGLTGKTVYVRITLPDGTSAVGRASSYLNARRVAEDLLRERG